MANTTKLTNNMIEILVKAAECGHVWAVGRQMVSARALEARGLVTLGKVRRGGHSSDTTKDTQCATVTDAGLEMAIELI